MTKPDDAGTPIFRPGKARWLQRKGAKALTAEQQALLLALVQLETDLGRTLSEDETAAVEALAGQLQGFDPQDIARAIRQMIETPADPQRQTSWAELRKRKNEG